MAPARGASMTRLAGLTIALTLAAEVALGWVLWRLFDTDSQQQLKTLASEQAAGHSAVISSYQRLVEVVFQQAIDRPGIQELLLELDAADPATRQHRRGLLYRALIHTYRILAAHDVRMLQFVTPDGRSFLRFSRPDLFGDPIAKESPLLRRVIAGGEKQQAFENGREAPGFRFAFPLFAADQLVAVVDFGVDVRIVQRIGDVHSEAGPNTTSRLILRRDLLEAVAHPSTRALFEPVSLDEGFVLERAPAGSDGTADTDAEGLPGWVDGVDRHLARTPRLRDAIANGAAFTNHLCTALTECFATALMPVRDSQGRVAAYVVSYAEDPLYAVRLSRFLVLFVIGSVLILISVSALRRLIASRRRLQTIGEHMGEGLYVMATNGRIIYANGAASELLGYSQSDLLGSDAHTLFHSHDGTEQTNKDGCPVRSTALRGDIYRSDEEVFRHRDGGLLRVNVVASPLREHGQINGIIVLFRDITKEYQARLRLRHTDTAFSNLAEAVIVTDADLCIRAVNAAFTSMTGYAEEEVIGLNPRILSSGRQDEAFYRNMWAQIAREGSWAGQIWNRRKDGEIFPEWIQITAVRDEQGQVVSYVGVGTDVTDARAKEARLRDLAYYDQLTGLYNRTAFIDVLARAVERAQVRKSRLALLYLDIDRFKRINETLGHDIGDRLLLEVAARVRKSVRQHDDMGRVGGDELTILLENVDDNSTAPRIAQAVLSVIREPIRLYGTELHVTASLGICQYPQDGADATTLLKNADAAMYLAKHHGRDGYRFFTPSLAADADRRFALESSLRRGLSEAQFRLFYQPKVSLTDGRIIGFEALIRWAHPEQGLLPPSQFLDEARDAGLIQPLTEWLLERAARDCAVWRADGIPVGRIACNLDALVFHPRALLALLRKTVREAGIDAADIELEILETAMHPSQQSLELWHGLVAAGFDLAIDDFGTGESSLGRLKQLPVSTLKIDRSFVRDIETDENDRSICRTVIAMAKTLDKQVIAEGVETEAQLRFLFDTGCDAVQGYLISRPMPAEQIADFVDRYRGGDLLRLAGRDSGLPLSRGA